METIRFEDLELDAKIMRAITDMGFEAASPIQGQAIPLELQGLDIIGQAQTGTGKTAAFGIPLLQKIDPKNKKPQAIQRIATNFQKDPQIVRVVKKELTVPKVTQYYYEVKPKNKLEVMCRLLDLYDPKLSVVFCNTKNQVEELVQGLQGRGYLDE